MECPKCHFDHPQQTDECLKCGIVFAKYLAFQEAVENVRPVLSEKSSEAIAEEQRKANQEFWIRVFALPGALVFGWLVNWVMPMLTAFLAMWLHEAGHAITGWLCGYNAFPTAWITMIGDRGRAISVVLGAVAALGGYYAFRLERWFWVAVNGAVVALFILGNLQTDAHSRMLFTFWGDGGAYVLATVLMLTIYARDHSPITKSQVRWGLLILGALAFWSVYSRWQGGFENIAQFLEDTDDRGIPSDPRILNLMYGWPVHVLIARYREVGHACLAVLAGAYGAGLVQAQRLKMRLSEEFRENHAAKAVGNAAP